MPHIQRRPVSSSDADALGHANNVAYVRWVQDAAGDHCRAAGVDLDALREAGHAFVVARHEVDYVRSAMPGDDLEVHTWVERQRGAISLRRTEIFRASDGELLARARSTWVFVDLASGKPVRLPEALVGLLPVEAGAPRDQN